MAIQVTYRRTRRLSMRIVKNGDVHVSASSATERTFTPWPSMKLSKNRPQIQETVMMKRFVSMIALALLATSVKAQVRDAFDGILL